MASFKRKFVIANIIFAYQKITPNEIMTYLLAFIWG